MRRAVSAADWSDLTRDLSNVSGGLGRASRADRASRKGGQDRKGPAQAIGASRARVGSLGLILAVNCKLQGDWLGPTGHQAAARRAWAGAATRRRRDAVTSRDSLGRRAWDGRGGELEGAPRPRRGRQRAGCSPFAEPQEQDGALRVLFACGPAADASGGRRLVEVASGSCRPCRDAGCGRTARGRRSAPRALAVAPSPTQEFPAPRKRRLLQEALPGGPSPSLFSSVAFVSVWRARGLGARGSGLSTPWACVVLCLTPPGAAATP